MTRTRQLLTALLFLGAPLYLAAQSASQSEFDHSTTGFTLEGAHRAVDCASCHVGGVFDGTPQQCSECHSFGGLVKATPVPLDHIQTTFLLVDNLPTTDLKNPIRAFPFLD